jgi:Ca2+-binding RTX toxin-like protein
LAALPLAFLLLGPFGVIQGSDASAAACRASSTISPDGTTLYMSPCAQEVAVSSPSIRTVYGTAGSDVIRGGTNVERIYGGEGNDVLYGGTQTTLLEGGPGEDVIYGESTEVETGEELLPEAPPGPIYEPAAPSASASITPVECSVNPCLGGNGDQQLRGGVGNDEIYGQRGNDELLGEGGDDLLYGGVGDDVIHGGEGNDFIGGGGGADTIYGESGTDVVRGDGTIDSIYGGEGTDTLSFSTGVTPGDEGAYPSSVTHVEGFPEASSGDGRGIYVRIDGGGTSCGYPACDNGAGLGGGDDTIATSEIENVIGTAFPDIIVGSSGANKIYGGGGGDVIVGQGGADEIFGGPEGDYIEDSKSGIAYGGTGTNNCVGVTTVHECTGTKAKVTQQEAAKMSAGLMMAKSPAVPYNTAYLVGSEGKDEVNAKVSGTTVTFSSYGATRFAGSPEGCTYEEEGKKAKCTLPASSPSLDAVVMAGLKADDHLAVGGGAFKLSTSPVLLGGEGNDLLTGSGTTEDLLVDGNGTGADTSEGFGYDDWLTNNQGVDLLEGGAGNDLILSTTTCDGDTLYGGEEEKSDGAARNNASWAKLPSSSGGVTAMLETQSAGSYYDETTKEPACVTGKTALLFGFDDLEGSNQSDALFGNEGPNVLNGHHGKDSLYGKGGDDEIEAQDEEIDVVNGGPENDLCIIDREIDQRSECETTEPPLIKTLTATPKVEPHNGEPGSATVKGSVFASEGSLSGRYLNVNFSKEEKSEWVLKATQHPTLNSSGQFETSQSVGVGSWRVKVVFPEQGPFLESESEYVKFTSSK